MKRSIISIIFGALLISASATACELSPKTAEGYENASLEHAYQHWKQGDKSPVPFVFLDVRTEGEFADGHIPGAMNIPVQVLADRLSEVPKNKRVYVYCRSGKRSTAASGILAKAGFTQIENVKASMNGWSAAHYPIEK